jgi:hypothetical protein
MPLAALVVYFDLFIYVKNGTQIKQNKKLSLFFVEFFIVFSVWKPSG